MNRAPTAADVTVVICCYTRERWDDVLDAVESVRTQQPPPAQVLLVVDFNPELLTELATHFGGTEVQVIPNVRARGLSGARNSGVAAATSELVAFLDDDAVASPGWLAAMLAAYADPAVLGVGGYVRAHWRGRRPDWFPHEFDWVVGCTYRGTPTVRSEVRNFIGANMSFRRLAFDRAGGFTEELGRIGKHPAGCEETEFCIRVRQTMPGARLVYEPAAVVEHRVSEDRERWRYFRRRCHAEGRSKALVARHVGADDALQSEREYTRRALPRGVRRGVRETLSGDPRGALRAGAIVAGLVVTASGYLGGRLRGRTAQLDAARA